jgi:pSer/pThr/pTyr-binding forkhead associated (FHA) protein
MPTFTISVNNKVLGSYVVKKPVISIGRSRTNTISIASKAVSRNHVRIEFTREGWSVTDLGSLNGTYVNDIRVTSAFLSDGDRVTVGAYLILFSPEPSQDSSEEEIRSAETPGQEPEGTDTDVRVEGSPPATETALTQAKDPSIPASRLSPSDVDGRSPLASATSNHSIEDEGTDEGFVGAGRGAGARENDDPAYKKDARLSLLRSNPAGLQLGDRVKLAILENPLAEDADLRKRLSDGDFGGANVSRSELLDILKQLGLESKIKRYNYFLHS